jgi:hypothetical protein
MNRMRTLGWRGIIFVVAIGLAAGAVYATGVFTGSGDSEASSVDATPDYATVFSASSANQAARPQEMAPASGAQISPINRREIALASAQVIGINTGELAQAVNGGQTITAIAAAHGVSAQKLRDGLIAYEKDELAKAVAAGQVTQRQSDQAARIFAAQIGRYLGDRPKAAVRN